jgi:hypothetical protein
MFELGQSVRVIHPHTGREFARGVVIHILRSRMGDEYTVKHTHGEDAGQTAIHSELFLAKAR